MPERALYDDAMRFAQSRLRVQDPDLKEGRVETFSTQTIRGSIAQPWGLEGGFAIVYKFRTRSGRICALRCFKLQVKQDTQFRYERLGTYFAQHIPGASAGFKYYDSGILVEEAILGQLQRQKKVYPIIEMDWVEGMTLLDRVDELCKKGDHASLGKLANQWITLLRSMRKAQIAHGDLAGNNVMVRTTGELVLVDYDGVYIPDFAGRQGIVNGQEDYQHPATGQGQRPFDEHGDDFSALVIYTALLALQVQPSLWNKYTKNSAQGKLLNMNLLFEQQDFKTPHQSRLIQELESLGDPRLKAMVQALKRACQQPVIQVRFPFELVDEKKTLLVQLEQAIQHNNDEQIAKAWHPDLEHYPPAQHYVSRVQQAQQTIQVLQQFRAALRTHNAQRIVADYGPMLDYCASISREERERLSLARKFVQAYNANDDAAFASACHVIQTSPYARFFTFTPQEKQRLANAKQASAALSQLRATLTSKNIQHIATAYRSAPKNPGGITDEERMVLQLAQEFVEALNADDDQDILRLGNEMQNFPYHMAFTLTSQEQQRISLAQQRTTALARFRIALANKNIQQIVTAYDPLLDDYKYIFRPEREQLALAHDFRQAYTSDDDQEIVASWQAIQHSPHRRSLLFTEQEQQRIDLAQQHEASLIEFRRSLLSKHAQTILAAYTSILDDSKNISQEERNLLKLARNLVLSFFLKDNDAAITSAWNELQNSPHRASLVLSSQEQQRLTLAQRRTTSLEQFRRALASKKGQQIVSSYDPLLDGYHDITADELAVLQSARRFVDMYQVIVDALGNGTTNDSRIQAVYDEELAQQFTDFTPEQWQRIKQSMQWSKLEQAFDQKAHGLAIRLARDIERASHTPLSDPRLLLAKQRFIRLVEARGVEARLQGNTLLVQWYWPQDDLVQDAFILWRTDRWPQHPKKEEPDTGKEWAGRRGSEHHSRESISLGHRHLLSHLYLQVYLAMPDYSQHTPDWFYSNGDDPTSKTEVR